MKISDIRIENRARKHLGDIDALAFSIQEVGLLQPIAVREDGRLVAGERRLEAVKRLGWEDVPVNIVHGLDETLKLYKAEVAENVCRLPMLPSEAGTRGMEIEPLEIEEARRRQGRPDLERSGKFPEQADLGDVRDKVGEVVGLSGKSYEKVKAVLQAAEESPELYGDLPPLMDLTGKIDRAYRKLRERQKGKEPPPDPSIPPPPSVSITGERYRVDQADCLDWLATEPADSIDLVFGSPPYERARLYLENGEDPGIARATEEWAAWMTKVVEASLRCCKGLVAFVLQGQTEKYRWSAAPALLMADLHRKGIHLRLPPLYRRVGIPGSGGPDWLRNDYEFIVCATRGGPLPWSNNTAMGKPPRFQPGGDPTHRTQDGTRVNSPADDGSDDGYASMEERLNLGPHRARQKAGRKYEPPERANPGNVIDCVAGGGNMGDDLCHENEAPFPEYLAEFFVRSFCPPSGVVCDPFCGSGTTGKMALQNGRFFVGCDIRASQVELTRKRFERVQQELFQE